MIPTRDEEKAMMTEPGRWPQWPFLPVKKDGATTVGYLTEQTWEQPIEPVVWLGNLFAASEQVVPRRYGSFDELLDDGWIVD